MSSTKVIIPEPCNKGWDNMTPNTNGRHCDTCDKTVVDFTQMNKEEIKHYFIEKSGAKICGHFRVSQVEPYRPKFHRKLINLYNLIEQKISIRVFKQISLASVAACMFLVGCQNKPDETKEKIRSCDKTEQTVDGGITAIPDSTLEGEIEMVEPIKEKVKKIEVPTAESKIEIIDEPTVDGDMRMEN